MVTIPDTSDCHDSSRVTGAGEADEVLLAIINQSSSEAIHSSNGQPIPISEWRITPKEDNSELFYITDPQSSTCLKDAGSGIEIDGIAADTFRHGPEHDGIRLWQLVARSAAAANLTPIDNTINFARPAMELLLSQWEDGKIVYTPKKPVATVASIDKSDIKTLKDEGYKIKASDEKALLNGGVRIDRQGFFQKTPGNNSPYFANMQGQVSKWSVFQVNIQTNHQFGVNTITSKMAESMNAKPPKEVWLEA